MAVQALKLGCGAGVLFVAFAGVAPLVAGGAAVIAALVGTGMSLAFGVTNVPATNCASIGSRRTSERDALRGDGDTSAKPLRMTTSSLGAAGVLIAATGGAIVGSAAMAKMVRADRAHDAAIAIIMRGRVVEPGGSLHSPLSEHRADIGAADNTVECHIAKHRSGDSGLPPLPEHQSEIDAGDQTIPIEVSSA